jgi:hypothetical protein
MLENLTDIELQGLIKFLRPFQESEAEKLRQVIFAEMARRVLDDFWHLAS